MKNKSFFLSANRTALVLAFLLCSGSVFAAWDASKPANDEKLKDAPALIRANWDALALGTDSALQITNAKVAAAAGIVDTKLATITTAGKVDGSAITNLNNVPSGAGALPIANGGTGQTTRQAALNGLSATSLTGTSGQSLTSNGTNVSLGYPDDLNISSKAQGDMVFVDSTPKIARLAAGTNKMFLQTQGAGANPQWAKVTLSDTGMVTGTLAVGNGGTGTTSLTDIGLPSQGGNSGKYLTTNGSASSWGTISTPLTFVSSTTVTGSSASSNISINSTKLYLVHVVVTGSSGGANLALRFNGDTSNYQYVNYGYNTSNSTIVNQRSSTASSILLGSSGDPDTMQNLYASFYIYPQGTTSSKRLGISGTVTDNLNLNLLQIYGVWGGSADATYFNIIKTSGSFTGKVYLYEISLT